MLSELGISIKKIIFYYFISILKCVVMQCPLFIIRLWLIIIYFKTNHHL